MNKQANVLDHKETTKEREARELQDQRDSRAHKSGSTPIGKDNIIPDRAMNEVDRNDRERNDLNDRNDRDSRNFNPNRIQVVNAVDNILNVYNASPVKNSDRNAELFEAINRAKTALEKFSY